MSITVAILAKETAMAAAEISTHYLIPLAKEGIAANTVQVFPLIYNTPIKISAKTAKAYLDKLITKIPSTVTKLIITDSHYFKYITKMQKVTAYHGTAIKGAYEGYTNYSCVYVPSYKTLFKQPENNKVIELGLKAIAGNSQSVVIRSVEYGFKHGSDREILDSLYQYPVLSADIETTGLALDSEIVSVSFGWTRYDGVAIDLSINGPYYLKKFLETYQGKLVFHGGLFDAKLLIRSLWMEHSTDHSGMMKGLSYFRDFDDTMILAYLAKNATTQVGLSLKELALEYVGNYAIEISDITKYTKKEILKYNLIDVLGTFYLYETYAEELKSRPYLEVFQPSLYSLLKMMLVGLPMDSDRVKEVHSVLSAREKVITQQLQVNSHIVEFNTMLRQEAHQVAKEERTAKLISGIKVRNPVKPLEDFQDIEFNPASHPQLSRLLFEVLELPVLDTTKTGAPSVGGATLADLKNHTTDQELLDLLVFIQDLSEVNKINGTFIKAFMQEEDFLHGNLKLGGTQSGRLSSNSPNLTNLPAHGSMGKLVKSCIVASDGWLFAGADFSALEERIGAILSQDPNRIKVYTDGYDGHSMRAYKYFTDQMPDIDPTNVDSINSIADKYPELRRQSKAPTFALQYDGTWHTLEKRVGFPKKQAKAIEKAYHELYKVSDEFGGRNKVFMQQHGYVECAFGLKLRTPIISQCILGNSKTPREAEREARSANNAVTQSWGMLLNRAMIATNKRIEEAGYGTDILPCNMIHDAGYFLVRDTPEHIKFLNDVLIEEMEWQEDPAIKSDNVPMKAEMEIGKSWDKLTSLKNNATIQEVTDVISILS